MIHLLLVDPELIGRFVEAPDTMFNDTAGMAPSVLLNHDEHGIYSRFNFHGLYLAGTHATRAMRASGVAIHKTVETYARTVGQTFVYFEVRRSMKKEDVIEGVSE